MNFKINQLDAIQCIQHVIGSTDKRDYMQLLSYVKVDVNATKGKARFTATNLDMQSSDSASITTQDTFSFTAPVHVLLEIVRKMPENSEIEFSLNKDGETPGKKIQIKSQKCQFEISGLPASDFPIMLDIDFPVSFFISATRLLDCLRKTQFSISNDELRYNLNGILMHTKGKHLYCISTDGHRLSLARAEIHEEVNLSNSIIPKKAVSEMIKILSDITEEEVTLQFSDKNMSLRVKDMIFITKLIDAAFPEYERVIPMNNDSELKIETKKLKKSIERVSIVNKISSDNKSMMFNITSNALNISSEVETDVASEVLEANYSGADITVKYNFKYILDAISHVDGDECLFKISDPNAPVLILSSDLEKQEDSRFVVMPMRN